MTSTSSRTCPEEWGYDGEAIRKRRSSSTAAAPTAPSTRRGATTPTPIDRPPFYVVEAVPAITFTFGGLRIDTSARVSRRGRPPDPGPARGRRRCRRRLRPRVRGRPRLGARLRPARRADRTRPAAGGGDMSPATSCRGTSPRSTTARTSCRSSRRLHVRAPLVDRRRGARVRRRLRRVGGVHGATRARRAAAPHQPPAPRGRTEVATGWTTRYDAPLGTFTFAVELDDDGRARRLFAARTEAFAGVPF